MTYTARATSDATRDHFITRHTKPRCVRGRPVPEFGRRKMTILLAALTLLTMGVQGAQQFVLEHAEASP